MRTRFKILAMFLIAAVWLSSIPVYAAPEEPQASIDYPVFEDGFVRKSRGTTNYSYENITAAHGAQYGGQGITVLNAKYYGTDEIIAAMKLRLPTKAQIEENDLNQFDFVFHVFKNPNYTLGNQSYIFHYATDTNWSETSMTWNTKPSFLDRSSTQTLFRFEVRQNEEYEFKTDAEKMITVDITDTILQLVEEGREEITVFTSAQNSLDSSLMFHSKETSNASKRPKMVGSHRPDVDPGPVDPGPVDPEPTDPVDPSDPGNIAYQKPARSNLSKHLAGNVTDGNPATAWSGIFYPAYIDIDLMDQYDLSELKVFLPPGKIAYYTIYGSNDGATYDRLYQKRSRTAATADGDTIVLEAPASYRIVRIYMEYTQGENTAYLAEVRAYGTKTNTNTDPLRTGSMEEILGLQNFKDTAYSEAITDQETYDNIAGIVERTVGPQYRDWFSFEVAPNTANEMDYFELSDRNGKVHITGNTGISITTGLNYYYKNYLNVHISEQTMQVKMPSTLVTIGEPVRKETEYKIRYAFNYCTLSYSFAFFGVEEWQRENDWLALNGVNVVLDLAGQEATWVKFLMNFGYSFDDAKDWLTGPAYNAWQFMANMEAFGGPVPDGYIIDRAELARSTMRWKNSLGMQTVLQGYAGVVPTNFNEFQPDVAVIKQGLWNGFSRPDMIATDSPLYDDYARLFYEAQEFVYGKTSQYYAADPFHEGGRRPSGLSDGTIAHEVLNSMLEYDEDAVWIVQGWQSNPTNDLLRGMGDRREDHVLIVDLIKYPLASFTKYNRTSYDSTRLDAVEFNGTSWVWGLLGNFGGNPSMHGQMEVMVNDIQNAKKTSKHMAGLGIISEAQYENPILYDLIFDLAWADESFNLDQWMAKYIERRYGGTSSNATLAWDIMKDANYNYGVRFTTQIYGMKNTTPQNYGKQNIAYGADKLETAFRLLAEDFDKFKASEAYLYDLTEIMRQLVSNYSVFAYNEVLTARDNRDLAAFKEAKADFLHSFDVLNAVQATQQDQLAGEWIGRAQDLAAPYDDFTNDAFELNAKTLITTWGSRQSHGSLKEYGWRNYEGMFIDIYKNVWETYLNKVEANLETGAPIATISVSGYFDLYWDWVLGDQDYNREAKDSAEDLKEVVELVFEHAMLSGELDPNIGNRAIGRLASTNTASVSGRLLAATDGRADTQVTLQANPVIPEPELIIDLVGAFQLSKVQVLADRVTFAGYEVYTSNDKLSWDKIGEVAVGDVTSSGNEWLVSNLEARYVKIQAIAAEPPHGEQELSLSEVRVYGERILPTLEHLRELARFAKTIPLEASEPGVVTAFQNAMLQAEQAIAMEAAVDQVNSVYWSVYDTILRLNLTGLKNLAVNRPVTAHNGTAGNPARLVDNSRDTVWDSGRLSATGLPYEATITPGWATIALGDVYHVEEIQVIFGNNNQGYWHNYELYTSLNGTDWTKVGEKTTRTTPNEAEDNHMLENVQASYIRMATTNIQESGGRRAPYQVAELRVLGAELDAVTSVTELTDVRVPYGMTAADLMRQLPSSVEVVLESGATRTVAVVWEAADYDGTKPGEYTVNGTLPSNLYNPDARMASVKVIVGEQGEPEPPVWPDRSMLRAANVSSSGLTLTWTAADDAEAVTAYNIYNGSRLIGTTAGDVTTFAVSGLSASTTYTFKVEAGNELDLWTTSGPSVTVTTERGRDPINPWPPVTPPVTEPQPEPNEPQETNEITVIAPVIGAGRMAKASISAEAFDKAAAHGATVVITVNEASGAAGYEVVLPPHALSAGDKDKRVMIRTPLGTVTARADLLPSAAGTGAQDVSLSITKAAQGAGVELAVHVDGKAQAWRNPNAPLEVFLPYTPTAAELADTDYLFVWYVDEAGKRTAVASGSYDAERGGVSFQAEQTGRYMISYVHTTFGDLQGYAWARQAIEAMASRGIIHGTSAETYHPAADIKRADFMVLLVRTLQLQAETAANFADVAPEAYYAEEVAVAKALGITQGTGDNRFRPEQSISRQEMMVLLDRALALMGQPLEAGTSDDLVQFRDQGQVAGYAEQSVANLVKSGLIQGKGEHIDPLGQATRAEIAVLIERLYHFVF
ncbi:alpha-N-acetylglucosaminidase TIM-barrel domain-containing protein [Paenibacillus daejeonensis]|uniref:alpha-N-acetylglucosaminidase TIM-barrel domain-containing protein n=1 Tax=Paenibacillus daejeonensis TaxID=135193 RepID=UPI00037CCB86|nr:alpha-N-acetylglucosaminidase TIM-barrel domain-containing protein [Paenibacillus daejeonensis]